MADEYEDWTIPDHYHQKPSTCKGCSDTGAVMLDDGAWGLCLCPAGEGLDALNHVARLNETVQESRRLREMARRG